MCCNSKHTLQSLGECDLHGAPLKSYFSPPKKNYHNGGKNSCNRRKFSQQEKKSHDRSKIHTTKNS